MMVDPMAPCTTIAQMDNGQWILTVYPNEESRPDEEIDDSADWLCAVSVMHGDPPMMLGGEQDSPSARILFAAFLNSLGPA